jgi:hypothetical protein
MPEKDTETQKIPEEDADKAKSSGKLFGDPIFIVE